MANFVVERGDRLDRVLADSPIGVSRRRARALIDAGAVFVDGHRCRVASRSVFAQARVVVHLDALDSPESSDEKSLPVLWRGDDLVAVNKPPGLHVNETETSARASVVSVFRGPVFVVHRLDRETSGVLLLARTPAAAAAAGAMFEQRQVEKTYWALTARPPDVDRVDAPIGSDRRRPRARAVRADGKPSCTELRVLGHAEGLAAVEARPVTGRTHQVRVHLAHAGSPILGDTLYGGPAASRWAQRVVRWPRVMLHAVALAFSWSGERVQTGAPLPDDFVGFDALGLPDPGPRP